MKIYLIEKPYEYYDYDTYRRFVIVANSKEETIKIAQSEVCNEPIELWSYSKITECGVYTGNETEPFILLSDYLRG